MEATITLWWLAGGLVLAAAASLGDLLARRRPLAWHAHLPWRSAIFVAAGGVLFAAAHLLTIARQGG